MRATLYRIKLEIDRRLKSGFVCAGVFHSRSGQVCNVVEPARITPKSKVRSNICLEEFPLHSAMAGAMVLIIIFSVGKIDRSSNKDGSG